MPSFTKQAIIESFVKLLNERPVSQITVKDIVEDCGVNRNSFYYHFEDLPSLLEELVTNQCDLFFKNYSSFSSFEECMDAAIEFAIQNKKAALHIFNSANRDVFERYLMRICNHAVTLYLQVFLEDTTISKEDYEILFRFYRCELFGQIIDWMSNGMKEDIRIPFHRLCRLREGMLEELIRRFNKN